MTAKAEAIRNNLKASTWHELETTGKFNKNAKLIFISDDMLILGCDVGSETHYLRAIDTKGREFGKSAFPFSNSSEGFQSAKEWAVKISTSNNKKQIVMGLEPTGQLSEIEGQINRKSPISVTFLKYQGLERTYFRERLQKWAAFQELHVYYTTRPENPLKKMQSLIVIACKLLRVIYTILT